MSQKADLSDALADIGGSTRRRPVKKAAVGEREAPPGQPGRVGTVPITSHLPPEVRDQLKIMAVENRTTMHRLIVEAYNDLFAKYCKPEIAPRE